ncbi:hypothetical protein CMEL01_03009 [Colletotrichum melonis]|uniref:Actin-like ATPase domain-containing protein n=1 Tax=Colletotrichum melonis TaxID=1209925 RepID=A0AAI9UK82_9PEZI|nr:hypothetical protein CMEL01_03009 [Colletotrichum melonis]
MIEHERQTAILALDWGSSAIRGSILTRDTRQKYLIFTEDALPGHDQRYQKGAFSSALYLDGIGRVYTGEDIDQDREPVPSKPFFSTFPKTGDDATDALFQGSQAEETWYLVKQGMNDITRTVIERVESFCNGNNDSDSRTYFYIEEIGLSYPAHWRLGERTEYENLLRKNIPPNSTWIKPNFEVSFHVESLASAHKLFATERLVDEIFVSPQIPVLVVFLDFGGHTMNGCMFSAQKSTDGKLSYHRMGQTFSTFGGTQWWEQEVNKFMKSYVEKTTKRALPPRLRSELLESFQRKIVNFKGCEVEPMYFTCPNPDDEQQICSVNISLNESKSCFLRAMGEPLNLAERKIAEAVSLSAHVKVVLSGGSGKNSAVQARLNLACRRYGLSEPSTMYTPKDDSWNICRGAALATANTMSVRESIAKGAAFGFQRGSLPKGPKESGGLWEEEIEVSLDLTGPSPWKRWFSGKSRVRIICDPFLQVPDRKKYLRLASCCDVIELPQPHKGYWLFELEFEGVGDERSLVIQRHYMGHGGKRIIRSMPTLSLPLYYDSSYCCCLIDTEVDDEGFGLLVTKEGDIVACPERPAQNHVERVEPPDSEEIDNPRKRKRVVLPKHSAASAKLRGVGSKPSGHLPELKPADRLPNPRIVSGATHSKRSAVGLRTVGQVRGMEEVSSSGSDDSIIAVAHDTGFVQHAFSSGRRVMKQAIWSDTSNSDSEA